MENGLELTRDALILTDNGGLLEEYGKIAASLAGCPDIAVLFGQLPGAFNEQVALIRLFPANSPYYKAGDEDYTLTEVPYDSSTIDTMIDSMYALTAAMNQITETTGKPDVIASDYEKYVY